MKTISLLAATALLLSACASSPVAKKDANVQGMLAATRSISLRTQPDPAKIQVRFNMNGYTIIGVAMVGVAIHKMNLQTDEFSRMVADYNHQHPDIPTLQNAFNADILAGFKAHGIDVGPMEVTRISDEDDKKVVYKLAEGGAAQQPVVVIDRLAAGYLAKSSTDPYRPGSSVMVTVISKEQTRQQILVENTTGATDPARSFEDFDTLKKNFPATYADLLDSVHALAKKTVDDLLSASGKPIASNN